MTVPQSNLFGEGEWWESMWAGMPEFVQEEQKPLKTIEVNFRTLEDSELFLQRTGRLYHDKWMWWPPKGYGTWKDQSWTTPEPVNPRYPVYVISKGRWESRLTVKALDSMGVPHLVVVEPQERDAYAAVMDPARLLVLPFSNLGQGGIPARNYVWEHATASGARRHWIMDDNINGFYRLNRNVKLMLHTGAALRAAEDFVDRYHNVPMAGLQYESFAQRRVKWPPFHLNTRVYSCILLSNEVKHRWRGRYNEDTDLSLRFLKDGFCTVLFYAFLANKVATMRMAGGNTDELYQDDGRLLMAQSLAEQHPDVTKITWKWGRWQHHVDYTPFERNKLIARASADVLERVNEYGMRVTKRETSCATA